MYYRDAYEAYNRKFSEAGIPFHRIVSLLIAGTYYLVLHRRTSTFGEENYDTAEGRTRLHETLQYLLDMLYEQMERRDRVSEAARRLHERGVDDVIIYECLKDL